MAADSDANLPALLKAIHVDVELLQTLQEVKGIKEKAKLLMTYAKGRKDSISLHNTAAAVSQHCDRRIGRELKGAPASKGGWPRKKLASAVPTPTPEPSGQAPTAEELGFSRQQKQEMIAMADVPKEAIDKAAALATEKGRRVTNRDFRAAANGTRDSRRTRTPRQPRGKRVRGNQVPGDATMLYRCFRLGVMVASVARDPDKLATLMEECNAAKYTAEIIGNLPTMRELIGLLEGATNAIGVADRGVAGATTPTTDDNN